MQTIQRGASLVELMVGLAVGLVIIAAATQLLAQHLRATHRQTLDARVSQDVRTIADLVARELRRAGYWEAMAKGHADATTVNPHADIVLADAHPSGSYRRATYAYGGNAQEARDAGFCSKGGTAYLRLGGTTACGGLGWHALNDPAVVQVLELSASTSTAPKTISLLDRCTRPVCPDGSTVATPGGPSCGPRLTVREFVVRVAARPARREGPIHRATQTVRLPNDALADLSQAAHQCPHGD